MRVLIADDDLVTTELVRCTLVNAGYEVATTSDGDRALAAMETGEFRLVVCDWEMPGHTGPELCRRIRRMDHGYVYVIMLTSRTGTSNVVEALTAGADEFLSKPVEPSELLLRVRTGMRIISLETREMAIFALAKLAESRDNETGAHLERVREYSRIIARALISRDSYSVNEEFVKDIYLTSPLHDIGKVGIPDSVLLKPDLLTQEEFTIMKRHTTIGAETIDAVLRTSPGAAFLSMARDIALTHHEKWNGSGYPNGLSGEAIPLAGRIVAVADVYDALTSKRTYKSAFPHEVARGIMLEGAGKHFDPDLIPVFLQEQEQFQAVHAHFSPPIALAA
jgi:putative two-component system response regulator